MENRIHRTGNTAAEDNQELQRVSITTPVESPEFKTIVLWMVKELSGCRYGYRNIVGGCYDTMVEHKGFTPPPEGKEACVNRVIEILNRN